MTRQELNYNTTFENLESTFDLLFNEFSDVRTLEDIITILHENDIPFSRGKDIGTFDFYFLKTPYGVIVDAGKARFIHNALRPHEWVEEAEEIARLLPERVSAQQMWDAIVAAQNAAPEGCKYQSIEEALRAQINAYPDANFWPLYHYYYHFQKYYDYSIFE